MPLSPRLAPPRRRAGQAVVEYVGVVVLVAIVVGISVWAARELRPGPSPPAFIERVTQPLARPPAVLERDAALFADLPLSAVHYRLALLRSGPGGPSFFGNALRSFVGLTKITAETGYIFGRSFVLRVKDRAVLLVTDPGQFVTGYLDGLEGFLRDPVGSLGPNQLRRIRAYIDELRSLPPREALRRLADDAGAAAADVTIQVVTRRVTGALRSRLPGGTPPAPPAPPSPPPTP